MQLKMLYCTSVHISCSSSDGQLGRVPVPPRNCPEYQQTLRHGYSVGVSVHLALHVLISVVLLFFNLMRSFSFPNSCDDRYNLMKLYHGFVRDHAAEPARSTPWPVHVLKLPIAMAT